MNNHPQPHPASFRDPSGFLFFYKGKWYRAVQEPYRAHYDALVQNGLLQKFIQKGWLLPHEEVTLSVEISGNYKILLPQQIAFQTYPYEWCFGQLQDAALLTLDMALEGLQQGFILKDATAYNVFFEGTTPRFLDTLSLEPYNESLGWKAFQQFCRHFVYPLLWMSKVSSFKPLTLLAYPDGVDVHTLLQQVSLSKLNVNYALYVHLPAKLSGKKEGAKKQLHISPQKQQQNLQHLRSFVASIKAPDAASTWNDYYEETIISDEYFTAKQQLLHQILSTAHLSSIVDLGANEGAFSQVAAQYIPTVLSCDMDASCVHRMYVRAKKEGNKAIYPFITDLLQPAPAAGFLLQERASWMERVKADGVMALALVHHLRIACNVPWSKILALLHHIAPQYAIVEFVPKEDEKVKLLLSSREDIFDDYTEQDFLQHANAFYTQAQAYPVPHSLRKIFVLQNDAAV